MKVGSFLLLLAIIMLMSCNHGEQTARRVCAGCHLFPEPSLLPADIWDRHVLPQMALRLGITSEVGNRKLSPQEAALVPEKPLVSRAEWKAIRQYYLSQAPAHLTDSVFVPVSGNIGSLFYIQQVQLPAEKPASISSIRIDTAVHQLYAADAVNNCVWYIDATGVPVSAYNPGGAVITDMQLAGGQVLETSIGTSLNPTPEKVGTVSRRGLQSGRRGDVLLQRLYRPVHTLEYDLDGDDLKELITCEFGVDDGKLSVWRNCNGRYEEVVLYRAPGAVRIAVTDMNADGMPDILCLFGQGNEQLRWFENKGHFSFASHLLLRFPPVYGSTDFALADMDGDGRQDIIYTCGDNADFSPVLKPYHGICIYHNNGRQSFSLCTFLPQNGATQAVARDFDGDGDTDIATIAYFPDTSAIQQDEFRLYLNNNGHFATLSNHLGNLGRWLVMDAADIDGDGDCDIALGSYPMMMMAPGGYRREWQQGPGVVLLINKRMAANH
ncbi:MAG TPA: VCBS repeat-containing protein [Chitinophaga sp.]|uniref:FG-GAP repeat domain-containing protein n=1 Tax=Chitinophaga sp. TaxID=1869181 RepID=UPI002C9EFEBE|nr:VCBS repeat-containing protein [Chitinophaga sp.]HVI46190.1 VCBS repeat-containing protein [Chitinophaga sp.]